MPSCSARSRGIIGPTPSGGDHGCHTAQATAWPIGEIARLVSTSHSTTAAPSGRRPAAEGTLGVAVMDGPETGSDDRQELEELRRRAYGLHPDIQGDVEALTRLTELEEAHRRSRYAAPVMEAPVEAAPTAPNDGPIPVTEPQPREDSPAAKVAPPVVTRRWRLIALLLAATIAAIGALTAAIRTWDPPADAALEPTGDRPDDQLLALLEAEDQTTLHRPGVSEMQIDPATLRAFGTYEEVEVWSAANTFGSSCLIGVHRATDDVVARQCMPNGAEPFMDMYWDVYHDDSIRRALPEGHVLRFILRPDRVDVYELVSEGVG